MAPQTDEFGTKVGAARPAWSSCARSGRSSTGCVPGPRSAADDLAPAIGVAAGDRWRPRRSPRGGRRGSGCSPSPSSSSAPASSLAGSPAAASSRRTRPTSLDRVPHEVDPATFPPITVEQDVDRLEPRDRRAGRPGDRPDAGREPRAREPGAAPRRRDDPDGRRPRRPARRDAGRLAGRRRRPARIVVEPLPVRRRRRDAARPVRRADRPEPRPRLARHGDRGDLRRRRARCSSARRRRSPGRSSCAGRPAGAGSTSPCCRRQDGELHRRTPRSGDRVRPDRRSSSPRRRSSPWPASGLRRWLPTAGSVVAEDLRPCPRRGSSRRRTAAGDRPRLRRATSEYFVGGGVAAVRLRRRRRPTSTSPAASEPAALYRNGARRRRAAVRAAGRRRRPTSTAVTGAYPLDVDGDGMTDLACCGVGENVAPARPRRLPVRARQRGAGRSTAATAGRRRSARPGRATTTLPTLAFGNYLELDATGEPTGDCADNELVRPGADGDRLRRADRALARLLHALDAVQRLGPLRPARPAGVATTATTTADGEEQLWRIEPGRAAAPVHRARRLAAAADLGHGHRQPGPDRRRLPGGLPDQPGRQQAPDARRRAGAARPTRTSRSSAASTAHRPFAGGDDAAVDRLAPRVRGRQQRRLRRPVRLQGQRRARSPTTRMQDPSNLLLGQPDGTFVEGAEAAGHRRASSEAAGRRSSTSTSTACSTSSRSSAARTCGCGGTSARATRRRAGADGPLARPCDLDQAGAEPRRDRRLGRGPGRRPDPVEREVTVGGGHAGGQLGWIHFGLGYRRRAPRSA